MNKEEQLLFDLLVATDILIKSCENGFLTKEERDKHLEIIKAKLPKKYYSGLSEKEKEERKKQFDKQKKMDDDDPKAYKEPKSNEGVKTKESKHTKNAKKRGYTGSLEEKAKASGVSLSILKQVYNRGMAAWKTGHRPGASQSQWAHARVNSFLTGGKTRRTADKDLWEKHLKSKKEKAIDDFFIKALSSETFSDYPQSATNAAKRALKWREEHGDEVDAGTAVGWQRANQLAKRETLSYDVVKRMAQFNRHRKNAVIDPKHKSEPWKDNGYVAWLLWGGTSGVDWAIRTVNRVEKEKRNKVEKAIDGDGDAAFEIVSNDFIKKGIFEDKKSETKNIAVVILRDEYGKILFIKRSSSEKYEPNKWSLPGGMIEEGESPKTAAVRELFEETNLLFEEEDLTPAFFVNQDGYKEYYFYVTKRISENDNIVILDAEENTNYCFKDSLEALNLNLIEDLESVIKIIAKGDKEIKERVNFSQQLSLEEYVKMFVGRGSHFSTEKEYKFLKKFFEDDNV